MKDLKLEDIPGIGEKIIEKLREMGYTDPMAIAVTSSHELATIAEISESQATKIINSVRQMLDIGFETVNEILERKNKVQKISTGIEELDDLLGGGIETQTITEISSLDISTVSHIAQKIAVVMSMKDTKTIYIDTNGRFHANTIKYFTNKFNLNFEQVLGHICYSRAETTEILQFFIEKIREAISKDPKIRLIITDDIAYTFLQDFVGRGELAPRQQILNKVLHKLQSIADDYNIPVLLTNIIKQYDKKPFGSAVMDHHVIYRIEIKRDKKGNKTIKLTDSPNLSLREVSVKSDIL